MPDVLTRTESHVGIAERNRPPHNFFDKALIRNLATALDGFEAAGMRAILLCAQDKNFYAGADFKEGIADKTDRRTPQLTSRWPIGGNIE